MMVGAGKKTYWWPIVVVIFCIGLITAVLLLTDEHRSVTARMGWECVTVEDTGNAQYPHVEEAKFWFRENPRYEERATGPRLCADLQASGASDVEMTFDTWGTRIWGLHGYDTEKLKANGKEIVLYGSESGGYHGDAGYGSFNSVEDMKQHPEKYKFPIDTFKKWR
jgi:hypothetical protein